MAKDTGKSREQIADAYLVSCAVLGDRTAQEKLVNRFQTKFIRHAYRLLGDAESAKDAVQDGWVEILRGLTKLRDESAFRAWSFRIVTRQCSKQIARAQKNRATKTAISKEPEQQSQQECDFENAADRRPVRRALADLPTAHRAAVALFYLEEMSVAEVAVAMEIPVGTVKSRLLNARHKLRAALEGEYHG